HQAETERFDQAAARLPGLGRELERDLRHVQHHPVGIGEREGADVDLLGQIDDQTRLRVVPTQPHRARDREMIWSGRPRARGPRGAPVRSAAAAPPSAPKPIAPTPIATRTIAPKREAKMVARTDMGGPCEPVLLHLRGCGYPKLTWCGGGRRHPPPLPCHRPPPALIKGC